nr:RNA-directed DNA polymerase, eukaryota, reverse transcriptase zinc-binding domain protein [Tanacetum cinerariifolium]
MLDGVWNTKPKDIKSAFLDFFKDKFSYHDSLVSFPLMLSAHCLSIADRDFLESMVFMDEIKHDIQSSVVFFFLTGMFPQGSNLAFITPIPKVSNPLFVKDYRPISLNDIHYKIVSKILANRLSKVIDSIISLRKSALLRNGQILDGPFILTGLASARTSILINGSPTSKSSVKIGLRLGDPLSSIQFIIVMEGLHMALNDGLVANMFHGVKVGSPASIDKGGLGVGSLRAFNMSLLLKWRWHLFHNSNALWVHVVKSIHGDEAGIDIRGRHINGVWASLFGLVNVGRTKTKFDALISDIANSEPEELVGSDTCIWILSHDDNFLVNSVRKHIDDPFLISKYPVVYSLLSTSMCCDDSYLVTPRIPALARCDRLAFCFLSFLYYLMLEDIKEEPIEDEPLEEPKREG